MSGSTNQSWLKYIKALNINFIFELACLFQLQAYTCVCCAGMRMFGCRHQQNPEEGFRFPGARVTGICEPCNMVAGKQIQFGSAGSTLNHSPGLLFVCLIFVFETGCCYTAEAGSCLSLLRANETTGVYCHAWLANLTFTSSESHWLRSHEGLPLC